MKKEMYIEHNGSKVSIADLEIKFKEQWKAKGRKQKDIQTLNMYYNVEDRKAYFVVNEEETVAV